MQKPSNVVWEFSVPDWLSSVYLALGKINFNMNQDVVADLWGTCDSGYKVVTNIKESNFAFDLRSYEPNTTAHLFTLFLTPSYFSASIYKLNKNYEKTITGIYKIC